MEYKLLSSTTWDADPILKSYSSIVVNAYRIEGGMKKTVRDPFDCNQVDYSFMTVSPRSSKASFNVTEVNVVTCPTSKDALLKTFELPLNSYIIESGSIKKENKTKHHHVFLNRRWLLCEGDRVQRQNRSRYQVFHLSSQNSQKQPLSSVRL